MNEQNSASEINHLRIIENIPIFVGVGMHEKNLLAQKSKIVTCAEETVVIEQGEAADRLYAIVKGSVLIMKKTNSRGWVKVKTLFPGDVFGEIAILKKIPRTARVFTQTACEFLTIEGHDFLEIYQYFPPRSRDNIQLFMAKRLEEIGRIV